MAAKVIQATKAKKKKKPKKQKKSNFPSKTIFSTKKSN